TNVGLLTGDNAINGDAPIVVMTTEVLRNMLYAGSQTLLGLGYVVMDEVHYLADRFRGAVWEEVIIHLPESVVLVSLSATVSNAEEFGDWLVTVRGKTEVIVSEHRPVPLWQHMMVGKRLFDLFAGEAPDDPEAGGRVNPQLLQHTVQQLRSQAFRPGPSRGSGGGGRYRGGRGSGHASRRPMGPRRTDVIARLEREGLLPAIVFIFSRAGCDAAVRQCVQAGLRLTDEHDRAEIRRIAEEHTAGLTASDLNVLGYWEWLDGLMRGLAAHHAGMLPAFKEVIERLFVRGLIKVVFATETLALGINMPARSVVLERLVKFNGEQHADITPGEYTQLTGRAGRRGIDVEGHAVVTWTPEVDPRAVAGLASTRTYPLISSFRPSYNMAVNLVTTIGTARARALLETSFAQFQADKSVVGLARKIQRNTEGLAGYAEAMQCDLGDFAEYAELRASISRREKALARESVTVRRARVASSLEQLSAGDVIVVPTGRRSGLAVVIDAGTQPLREPRPLVLTEDHWAGRLSLEDFVGRGAPEVSPVGRVKVPRNFNHRSPRERRDLASTLRNASRRQGFDASSGRTGAHVRSTAADDTELEQLRAALRRHPCHACPDVNEHARWAQRRDQLRAETDKLEQRVRHRTNTLSRGFDKVCAILSVRGYLMSGSGRTVEAAEVSHEVTAAGRMLGRIWSESDLLVAECLRLGVWEGLNPAELAGAVSALLFESRGADSQPRPIATGPLSVALERTVKLWAELEEQESERGLSLTKQPDIGFVRPMLRWARGESLERTLTANSDEVRRPDTWRPESSTGELSAGDFVRWARQVLDLLDQIAGAAPADSPVRPTAMAALTAVRRGILTTPAAEDSDEPEGAFGGV
ncbi:MAG: DEAD/DEAH box helicase, partial [Mycobacteriales bacterium]